MHSTTAMIAPKRPRTNEPLPEPGRVLLVDDEPALLRAYSRTLKLAGHQVVTASDGAAALAQIAEGGIDVVVSDISMPGMSGIELLSRIRDLSADLPVILVTGSPTVDTAVVAVAHRAFRYLVKPFEPTELVHAILDGLTAARAARKVREATGETLAAPPASGEELETRFERALAQLWMAYQPIVSWSRRELYSYEALVRTREPTLVSPGAFFDAAERLGRLQELGRTIRAKVALRAAESPDVVFFVNLHPDDLLDDELFDPLAPLGRFAQRIVLEITERATLEDIPDVRNRVARLRAVGYRIALDDLGSGYAGLTSFTRLEPDVIKLDMSLARNVEGEPTQQKVVRAMTALCAEMGRVVIAEGVETTRERDTLVALGCDYFQGYLFAKPADGLPQPAF